MAGNHRNLFIICAIGFILIMIVCTLEASAASDEISFLKATNCTPTMPVINVDPMDTVELETCVDLEIVKGWYGKVAHESGEPVIDISAFSHKIYLDPGTWKTGIYNQWADYDEPNANLFVFTVISNQTTQEEYLNMTQNVTVTNKTALMATRYRYNLEELPVSDILVARGDPLWFNNTLITNTSRAWLFGTTDGIYDYPCNESALIIGEDRLGPLKAGMYYVMIDTPGLNTIPEAIYDTKNDRVISPLRSTPDLDIAGYSPRVVYDKIVPWLWKYSDDNPIVFKMEIQDPYLAIVSVDTVYSDMMDVIRVDGYTNLRVGTVFYASIDESNHTLEFKFTPRTYGEAAGDLAKPGTMREFRIFPPFDIQNKTAGQHELMVHGPFGTFAAVPVPVAFLPDGQERPLGYIRYVNSTIWHPTPTPIIEKVIETQTVTVVERVTVPVTPSDDQLRRTHYDAIWLFVNDIVPYLLFVPVILWLAYGAFRLAVKRIRERKR